MASTDYTFAFVNGTLTINQKNASVTPDPATKVYGDSDPAFTGTLVGFLPADGVTATYSRTAGETVAGSPYTISATLSPSGVLGNYNITYNTANFTITTKNASVTPNPATKVYGDSDPAFTGTLAGFLPADGVTATYSRTAGETVAGSPYTISAALSPSGVLSNYNITYNTANFTITTKNASVTPDPAGKTYGQSDPAFSGTLSGFLPADGVTATYSRTAGEGVGTYPISATLSPSGVLGNYNITYNTANFNITAAVLMVTANPAAMIYGGTVPTLTYNITGFQFSDNQGNSTTGAPVELTTASSSSPVGAYPISISPGHAGGHQLHLQLCSRHPDRQSCNADGHCR